MVVVTDGSGHWWLMAEDDGLRMNDSLWPMLKMTARIHDNWWSWRPIDTYQLVMFEAWSLGTLTLVSWQCWLMLENGSWMFMVDNDSWWLILVDDGERGWTMVNDCCWLKLLEKVMLNYEWCWSMTITGYVLMNNDGEFLCWKIWLMVGLSWTTTIPDGDSWFRLVNSEKSFC